ncbi:DASS family sodium-coupled anion symporter [Achromobacter sp. GG226]|uniref:SLC13 family permease n=1 Tax=Verticiella alkaliphila TaxID=2779529 RepID=UPI001C0CE18E|nr:DASS family sodium-coupled anion symporter [Verticiella sp. GG226]MBU4612210.1 DASS family sodium-coupled anion symporter [Verticiella sp. GG226]
MPTPTLTERPSVKPIPSIVGIVLFALVLWFPAPDGMTPEAWRLVAVALLMITWWITEAIPVSATALLPVALFPMVGATSAREATSPYGDPIIFLFMGGFFLAMAMERWSLHRRIALNIVSRTGSQQHRIVAGFMIATAFCGLWVSNTATAVMMFPVALSVAKLIADKGGSSQFPLALMLSVAYAASIGGIGTLIGTPPNALLAGALNQTYGYDIGFAQWMIFGIPIMLVMLFGAWVLLTRVSIRLDRKTIEGADELFQAQLADIGRWSTAEKRVAIVFVVTALLWIFRTLLQDFIPGLSDASIAILAAIALFLIPAGDKDGGALVDWDMTKNMPWGILVLFGGGLSLSAAVVATGLDGWIGNQLGTYASALPTIGIVLLVALAVLVMTEFMSNTATAATFIPIVAGLSVSLGENPLLLMVPATLAASMTFMLPVATPPNALVFSSGYITIGQMARHGFLTNVLSLMVITGLGYWLLILFFGVVPGELPDWAVRANPS